MLQKSIYKKMYYLVAIILTIVLYQNLYVFANEMPEPFILNASVINDTREVHVDCELQQSVAGKNVVVLFLNQGASLSNYNPDDKHSLYGVVSHIDMKVTDVNGKCSFDYTLPENANTGEYTVMSSVDESDIVKKTTFYYATPISLEVAKKSVNDANTLEEMKASLNSYKRELIIDTSYEIFNNTLVYNVSQNDVLQKMIDKSLFSSVGEIKEYFDRYVAIDAINKAPNGNMWALIKLVNETLLLDIDYYNKLADEKLCQEFICKSLSSKAFMGISDIQYAYKKSQAIVNVNLSKWQDMAQTLLANNAVLQLDLGETGKYSGLSNKDKVHQNICQMTNRDPLIGLDSIEKIKESFDKAVNDEYLLEQKSSGVTSQPTSGTNVKVSGGSSANIPPVATPKFLDIEQIDWAKDSIQILSDKGVINGDGSGYFHPNQNITREEFIKILIVALGLEDVRADVEFSDVSKDDWCYKYIANASKVGITNGIGAGYFGVGMYITRQEMATMIYRAAVKTNKISASNESNLFFSDKQSISPYAVESIAVMQSKGIINGMGDGTFAPMANATRAQAVKTICVLLKILEQEAK